MSRVLIIDGAECRVVDLSDIAPNGIEELRDLCRTTRPSTKGTFWTEPVPVHLFPPAPEKPDA
jgi:hypothetical protein